MDKRKLLSPSLARLMNDVIPKIQTLTELYPAASGSMKQDGTPVTALDLALSDLLEDMALSEYDAITVYSEEKYSKWEFPLMAIDPLDGTREYIKQRPEWAVSIGHFPENKFSGEGWVYNPLTLEKFDSTQGRVSFVDKGIFYGEVSHSEWERGFYKDSNSEKFKLSPMGSIAYKLGRLSAGKIDFVVSLAPKSIWDIAGGSLLCKQSGIKFYSQGKEVTEVKHTYLPPLIWCYEELYSELSLLFRSTDKRL